MNKKRNLYVFLTLFCLLAIIFLQAFLSSSIQKEFSFSFNKAKLLKNPNTARLEIMIFMYAAIIFIGFINLILFIVRNYKRGILPILPQQNNFILSEEKASKLLFLAIFFTLLIYISETLAILFNIKVNLKNLALFLNLILQIGLIFIVLRFIPFKSLNFKLTKEYLNFTLKAYITVLPIIIFLIFINYLILERIGMKSFSSPAIEIFFSLKNNLLILILSSQIVLFGPLAEELFFRGFLYNLARQKYSFIFSAGISSFIFTMLHKTPQEIFPLFALSVTLCYVYERTKNIAAPIIFHVLHNSASAALLFVIKTIL
jgi:membrane protease YdiL (CAAX protease family)